MKLRTINLNDRWQFAEADPGGEPAVDAQWSDISLPGDLNAALVSEGRIPSPHRGDDAKEGYWVTSRDWWLKREFDAPEAADGKMDLVLGGLDGHVDVYLNGQHLGLAKNAFRPHRYDIADAVRTDGPNVLMLRFRSIDGVMGGPREDELEGWGARRVLMRKPQYNFGWDWALPMPGIGVMGGVWIEAYSGARLKKCSVKPRVTGRIDFKFQVNTAARDAEYQLRVSVSGHGADIEKIVERPDRCFSHTSVTIEDPKLWWPRGMGEQPLYDYSVELLVGGEVVDRRAGRLGIREVEILEEPFTDDAGPGISFWITVNGERVFCKGANWIPQELWPAEAEEEKYRFHLQKAADANFNMLRVWGGGIYERDIFYDLCDELGIMVWQDFMFASAGYPVDLLRGEIIAEAKHQIRRLRNRPCICLWCGCNEDVYSWSLPNEEAAEDLTADTGVYSEPHETVQVNRLRDDPQIYSMILRGLVSRDGLGVPYVESSPQSYEDAGNMPESGNSHLSAWKFALFNVDDPADFRGHFEQPQSFDSEFCIQGPCSVETLRTFMPEEHWWPPDEMWTFHIQRGHRNLPHHEQTLHIAGAIFGEIDSLEEYVKHGQATHVEMMRGEFEFARRDRPNNGGTMMWMYEDCWPTSNWSIIDYYGRPKPSYYAAKRACAPVLPIIMQRAGRIGFFLSNDRPEALDARMTCGQARLDGTVVWSRECEVAAGPVETANADVVDRDELDLETGDYLFVDAEVMGERLPSVTYFPDGWKDIPWPDPEVEVELVDRREDAEGVTSRLWVRAGAYARLLHLLPPEETGFWADDNYFDLPAGCERTITFRSRKPFALEDVRVGHWLTEWP